MAALATSPGTPPALKVQQKVDGWRRQGCISPTMASNAEIAYTRIVDTLARLDREFSLRSEANMSTAVAAGA